jgi:cobalt-zinc-cadmium efflux system protein
MGHGHLPPVDWAGRGRAFPLAVGLNVLFVIVEFAFGFVANSTALLADAGHNLSDVLGLLLAWGAAALSMRAPNGRFTYGLRSSSILAAIANAMLLLVACGGIAWEAAQRFAQPPAVAGVTVSLVAGVGILVNGLSAWLFAAGRHADLNIRGAYLHMAADAAVSLGVAVAGLAMRASGWFWIDPAVSLIVLAVIVFGTWGLLRDSLTLALHAVPATVDLAAIEAYLRSLPGVTAIHDLHVWGMSTTENALTVHLVLPDGYPGDEYMDAVATALRSVHRIQHSTLQIERGSTDHACGLTRA